MTDGWGVQLAHLYILMCAVHAVTDFVLQVIFKDDEIYIMQAFIKHDSAKSSSPLLILLSVALGFFLSFLSFIQVVSLRLRSLFQEGSVYKNNHIQFKH